MVFENVKTVINRYLHILPSVNPRSVPCVNNALDNDDDDDYDSAAFPSFPLFTLLQNREAVYVRTYETRM